MSTFRELKARKAKYGFQAGVSVDTIQTIAEAMTLVQSIDLDVKFETNFNMGNSKFMLYTENDAAAQQMRDIFCQSS